MMPTCEPGDAAQSVRRPFIRSVLDLASGRHDHYTAGGRFILRGSGFGTAEEPTLDTGVYVHASGVSLQRVDRYEFWKDDEIQGYWPEMVSGAAWVFVEVLGDGSDVQSAVHRAPVIPVADDRAA